MGDQPLHFHRVHLQISIVCRSIVHISLHRA